MNVILDISQFDKYCIHFHKPIRNTVMENSNFIRLIYSNSLFSLTGIFIEFKLTNAITEKYFSKYKCTFQNYNNERVMKQLADIEHAILNSISIDNKEPIYKIKEQLQSGTIKLFSNEENNETNNNYLLKISGIWETTDEIGITFKFIDYPVNTSSIS